MKMPRAWHAVREKTMALARRYPRATRITGIICLVLAFLPYYYHTASDGPAEIDLPFFGKVKGPPEQTFFHIGLPWSPWVKYWRVLEYQGPFAWNYSYGYNVEALPGSAIPAILGVLLLFIARRARKHPAPEPAGTPLEAGESPVEAAPLNP